MKSYLKLGKVHPFERRSLIYRFNFQGAPPNPNQPTNQRKLSIGIGNPDKGEKSSVFLTFGANWGLARPCFRRRPFTSF